MKKSFIYFAFAFAALVSCSKEVSTPDAVREEVFEYTFAISSDETKAILGSGEKGLYSVWESGDKLRTFTNSTVSGNTGFSYSTSTVNASANPVTFTIKSYKPLNASDMVYAIAPDNSSVSATAASVVIPVSQTQSSEGFDSSALPLVAKPFPISAAIGEKNGTSTESDVKFYNLASLIEFDIFSPTGSYSTENIASVTFTANSGIAGSCSFDLTAIDINDVSTLSVSGFASTSVTTAIDANYLSVGDATGVNNAKKVYMAVAPGSYSGTVNVITDKAQYSYTISSAIDFSRASVRRLGINLEKAGARTALIYSTAFNYTGGSVYNSSTPVDGTDTSGGTSWSIVYGNWYENDCAQMRVYKAGNFGYLVNNFDCSHVTSVKYDAKVSNTNLKLNTYYSTDGGNNWTKVDDSKALTTSFATYSFAVPDAEKVRFKFEVTGTKPSSSSFQLTIDNVNIFGTGSVIGNPTITAADIDNVQASGLVDGNATYQIHNFTSADDITVTCDNTVVTAASVDHNGNITYTVSPNYTKSSRNGSITLTSSSQSASKTIEVSQLKSTLTVSATTVTIPNNSTSITFTVTSAEFAGTLSKDVEEGMNFTLSSDSFVAANDAQTITVTSTVAASATEQTLGTITIYRNENTSDPQKAVVTVKKASTGGVGYTKISDSITSGAQYLFVLPEEGKVAKGTVSSSKLTVADLAVSTDAITVNETVDGYKMTVTALTGENTGYYTISIGTGYLKSGSSTNVGTTDTVDNTSMWSAAIPNGDGVVTFFNKSSDRFLGYNGSDGFKQYARGNLGSYPLPTLYKRD